MARKAKASSIQQWQAIIKEVLRLHDEYLDFVIVTNDDFQRLLTIRARLFKLEERYDDIYFQIELESIDQNQHAIFTDKFTKLIAKINVNFELFEMQQQQQRPTCDSPIMNQYPAVDNPPPLPTPPIPTPAPEQIESNPQLSTNHQNFKLPEISLPSFGGEFNDWLDFRSSFSVIVVENTSVPPSVKFYYLKQALRGEALNRIQNVPAGNFDLAWSLLKQRYDNTRLIADTHVAAILSPPTLNPNSSQSWRAFIDHGKSHINALESLKLKVDVKDLLYMYIYTSCFDTRTLRDWERVNTLDTVPTMENLWDFMESQHKVAQAVSSCNANSQQTGHKPVNSLPKPSNNVNHKLSNHQFNNHNKMKTATCSFCEDTKHSIFNCASFLKILPPGRIDALRKKALCFNCMKPFVRGHLCFGSCRHCGKNHHTLLHEAFQNSSSNSKNVVTSNTIHSQAKKHVQKSCCCASNSGVCSQSTLDSAGLDYESHSTRPPPISTVHNEYKSTEPVVISKEPTCGLPAADSLINTVHTNTASAANVKYRSSVSIMPTAEVIVFNSCGQPIPCRALLDSGSNCCLISQELANCLALPSLKIDSLIHSIAGNQTTSSVAHSVLVQSTDQAWSSDENCIVVNKISPSTPQVDINIVELNIPNNIKLADPNFFRSMNIDLLLGTSVFASVMSYGQIVLSPNSPVIQNTLLGWIVFGSHKANDSLPNSKNVISNVISAIDVSNQLEKFWRIEELLSPISPSPEAIKVENHYNEHTTRLEDGRFIVSLPRKDNFSALGQSKFQALKRFYSLEKRLVRQPELKEHYVNFMQEYHELGHMTPVLPSTSNDKCYHIPHHAVFKPESTTTKVRVVFDASAKSASGLSLNDVLYVGSTIQPDLFDIVMRFRIHIIAFIGDITKMYRQVMLDPADRDFQRIFWRDDPSLPIQEFQLNTVSYGTASAAWLATHTLNKLAELESDPDSPVFQAICNDFYVDDLISGAPTIVQATSLAQELINTLQNGCFEIRKFMSNSSELLSSIPPHLVETSTIKPISDSDDGITKALGLLWNSNLDLLSISSNINQVMEKSSFTKRELLSCIASIFDPLGLISPVVVFPKIILQKLWLQKLDWDDQLPENLLLQWLNVFRELPSISKITIPRCVLIADQAAVIELHGFSDASSAAYGACVYVRSISNNNVQTRLLCSKSRVAPLKVLSIPKLELAGALVLSRLVSRVVKAFEMLNISISNIFLWSDSKTVCSWLQSAPDKKDVFVAVRVSEIQGSTSKFIWNHVKTSNNPADIISRGSSPNELADSQLWWHGPPWLAKDKKNWDSFSSNVVVLQPTNVSLVTTNFVSPFSNLFTRCSSSLKMIRSVAFVLRFIYNARHPFARRHGPLSVEEISAGETQLLKVVQQEAFNEELHALQTNEDLPGNNKFHSLSIFLHSDGLIRVGGRLQNAEISFDYQHQILLPHKHKFTKALIFKTHQSLCHAGVQATMSSIRQKFWIPSTRRSIKNVLRTCIKCFRFTHFRSEQLMGQLPAVRVNADFPFNNVGLDYAGPVTIRIGGPKSRTFNKAYFALFICMVTRAVHIEVVSELSTSTFLSALTRFVSKRGIPHNIYSDNATTFQGASGELQELFEFLSSPLNQQSLQNSVSIWRIQWNFIPPRAPHFGGLWERAIKHFKSIFKIVTLKRILNFEEIYTLASQVEAILNSRPIVPLSEDPHDLAFLSPGHFLIGRPLNALPSRQQKTTHVNYLARWHRLADISRQLWERWSQEYLATLQQKHKWTSTSPNIKVGILVLLKDPGTPPSFWKLGRIVQTFPGTDNKVRVVSVLTESGTFKRAIASVAPLPFDDSESA